MQKYNSLSYFIVTIAFIVLTILVIRGILKNNKRLQFAIVGVKRRENELAYFPRYCSSRAIICYVLTLVMVSCANIGHLLPFQFMLFGLIAIISFFTYSSKITRHWHKFDPHRFVNKLFIVSLFIRIVYVVFIYYYYTEMTGKPHMYHAGDSLWYKNMATVWPEEGFEAFLESMANYADLSDSGYCWWLGFEFSLFGTDVLPSRIIKCVIDSFSCILIYSLARRNFGENTARMAAVFYMLMPNTWYYCGVTLKETEMTFIGIMFVERGDMALRSSKIKLKDLLVPLLAIAIMLTFRTSTAAVMLASLVVALVLSSKKQLQTWKKVVLTFFIGVWMVATVGVELREEAQALWEGKVDNQESGYRARSNVEEGGNSFAQYATTTLFAPLVFTIPFSTMVDVPGQENQMMLNGANFIKNVVSIFVIFAMVILLIRREWRNSVLPIAFMGGYLVVLVFSNFAHSERFHFPVLGFELMFAAFGVSQLTNKHKRWYNIWLVIVCVANIAWTMIKLKGKGLA